MTWRDYFIIQGCSRFEIPDIGLFDARNDDISVEKFVAAFNAKHADGSSVCPYIIPTDLGYQTYFPQIKNPTVEIKEIKVQQPPKKNKKRK